MEKISDRLAGVKTRGDFRQLTELRPSESKPELDSNNPIWELWDRLTEFYGSAFTTQYGDEPTATWAYTFRELSADDFRRGFDLLSRRDSSFPPNPAEFLAMIGNDTSWERQCHKVIDTSGLIEDKTAKEKRIEQGKEEIRKLRESIGL